MEAGYREMEQGGREGEKKYEKKEGERPGPHVKVITQAQALTQHFSSSEALPPHHSSLACSLSLTFRQGACERLVLGTAMDEVKRRRKMEK